MHNLTSFKRIEPNIYNYVRNTSKRMCLNVKDDQVEYTLHCELNVHDENVKEKFFSSQINAIRFVDLKVVEGFHNKDYERFLVRLIERMNAYPIVLHITNVQNAEWNPQPLYENKNFYLLIDRIFKEVNGLFGLEVQMKVTDSYQKSEKFEELKEYLRNKVNKKDSCFHSNISIQPISGKATYYVLRDYEETN